VLVLPESRETGRAVRDPRALAGTSCQRHRRSAENVPPSMHAPMMDTFCFRCESRSNDVAFTGVGKGRGLALIWKTSGDSVARMSLTAVIVDGQWRPGIGDPSWMGWVTVAAYLGVAVLCWRSARSAQALVEQAAAYRGRALWWMLAGLFVLLAINKQLDLQSLVTVVGKRLAESQGWYEDRRIVQFWFICAVGGLCAVLLCGMMWLTRGTWRENWLVLAGTGALICFIVIRGASFHKVDIMLGWRVWGAKLNWVVELGSIACVGTGAVLNIARRRRMRRLAADARSS